MSRHPARASWWTAALLATLTLAASPLLLAPLLGQATTRAKTPAGRREHPSSRAVKHHPPAPKRAKVGQRVPVEITYYCLQGSTRTDQPTRPGIVAADPRVFPLRRHLELFVGRRSLGTFLVDDTGGLIRGHAIDVWVPSCADARHRGRRRGVAVLLAKGEQRVVSRQRGAVGNQNRAPPLLTTDR